MMQFMLCQNDKTQIGGKEMLQLWHENPDSWIWVDMYNEAPEEERAFLTETFALDDNAIIEAQRTRHPPSFDAYKDHIYLLLKPLDAESDSLDFNTLQLAMFAGKRFLISRHSRQSPYLALLWQQLTDNGCGDESPLSIVASMSKRVAQRYGKVLLNLEQRLDVIEDELFDTPTDTLMKELVSYNTGLRKMHRILNYYVDVFARLRTHLNKTGDEQRDRFDDIFAIIERFNSMADLYQNVITDLIDAYISLNGHRLNQIMKVLTIVTVIFVPLTLLVGIYGMNFEHMPELKSDYGYYILLSVMSGIAVLLLYLFRRSRWL
jgi:magnesium transporter